MEQNSKPRWELKVSAITSASPDHIWAVYTDFFNLHKWLPTVASCHGIQGINGELGCIRICTLVPILSDGPEKWSKERLIAIDHTNRSLSYEIVENNIGFTSYVSTVKIIPGGLIDEYHQDGSVIEWSVAVDPVQGWQLDDLKKQYDRGLQGMAKRIEDAHCL